METSNPRVRSDLFTDPSADAFRLLVDSLQLGDGVWSTIPEVSIRMTMEPEAEILNESALKVWPRTLGRGLVKRLGPRLTRVGPIAFVSTSVQTDRVLRAIKRQLQEAIGSREAPYFLPAIGPGEVVASWASARRSLVDYRSWFEAHSLKEPSGLLEELTKVDIVRRRTQRATFRSDGIRVLVVASQHNASTRAVLAAANASGEVATCYVPHAPVADNSQYRDLPVHVALLRGDAEVEFYLSLGADDRGRLRTVGLPGHKMSTEDRIPTADHFVYAASPRAEEVLRSDVDVISAIDVPVEVCLHPRSSPSAGLGIFPSHWTVHPPGPTLPFLWKHGARAVIQHGSGLGLEALASGAEVIDLCPFGDSPNYPYLAEPHAQIVGDAEEFAAAVNALSRRKSSSDARRAFARSWMSVTDTPASVRASDELMQIAEAEVPSGPLLDGWRPQPAR